jgi:hypothetical protein
MLKNLYTIDGFYGVLHQKIKSNNGRFDVCFSIIFANIAKYLLCQSEESSKKISANLK